MKGQRSPASSLRWILLCVSGCILLLDIQMATAGTVFLNGPKLQASDLRDIDTYVSQGLPIYPGGFQLYSRAGSRPIIIKMANPDGMVKAPNPGYYTNLPAVIPRGFEGIASTSFFLGPPLSSSQQTQQVQLHEPLLEETAQPSIRVENNVELQRGNNNELIQNQNQNQIQNQNQNQFQFQSQNQYQGQGQNQFETPQARSISGNTDNTQEVVADSQALTTNPVVVETSKFESSLPQQFRNPFYSNVNIAASLAQESLPSPGEEVVSGVWNTNIIKQGRIRDLLSGAGLI